MVREAHYPSMSKDEMTYEQVYGGLTVEYDLGYQEAWGVLSWKGFKSQ